MAMTSSTSVSTIMTNTTNDTSISVDNILRTKIENVTEGLPSTCFNYLSNRVLSASRVGKENALTICDYMSCLKSEINPSDHYRKDTITLLCNIILCD